MRQYKIMFSGSQYHIGVYDEEKQTLENPLQVVSKDVGEKSLTGFMPLFMGMTVTPNDFSIDLDKYLFGKELTEVNDKPLIDLYLNARGQVFDIPQLV